MLLQHNKTDPSVKKKQAVLQTSLLSYDRKSENVGLPVELRISKITSSRTVRIGMRSIERPSFSQAFEQNNFQIQRACGFCSPCTPECDAFFHE